MIGEAAALTGALCWAVGAHLFGRIGRVVPVGALNLGKCATGVVLFAVTRVVVGGRLVSALPASSIAWLSASGVIGLSLGDSAYFGAMGLLGVRRSLLLLSLAPVFTAIGGALFLGESLGAREIGAVGAVLAGVVIVVNEQAAPTDDGPLPSRRAWVLGVLFGLGAALGQAGGGLISRGVMASGVSPLDASMIRLLAGMGGMMLLAGLFGRLGAWARMLGRRGVLGPIAMAAFVGTYCGIWLSQVALGRASSAAVASALLATSPLFALPLGRWLNAEPITPRAVGGTALAIAGLALLTLAKS